MLEDPDLAAMQGTNRLGLAETGPTVHDARRLDGIGLAFNRWWQAVQIGRDSSVDCVARHREAREVFGVSATAALYRRNALDRVALTGGIFDPGLGSYYEDVDLSCRLRATGRRAVWVPGALVDHAGSASESAATFPRSRLLARNRPLVLARLLGRRFPAAAARALLRDLADLRRIGARGAIAVLGAWGAALRRLPAYAHLGAPRVPIATIRRLGAEAANEELLGATA
jgi:GT2 family glycosyltransferase